MMMTCNSPTSNLLQRQSNASSPSFSSPNKLDDSLASISHMIGLTPGIVRPLAESKTSDNSNNSHTHNTNNGFNNTFPQTQQNDGNDYWRRMGAPSTPPRSPVPVARIGTPRGSIGSTTSLMNSMNMNNGSMTMNIGMTNGNNNSVQMSGSNPNLMNNMGQNSMYHYNPSPVQTQPNFVAPEKPPYSFPCLIGLALTSCDTGRMSVSQIYDYVTGRFPYFKTAKSGWKNSVRHNLSLNKFFCKLERREHEAGKGSMWGIVPENKEQLLRDIASCKSRYPINRARPTPTCVPQTPPPKTMTSTPFLNSRANSAPAFSNMPMMKMDGHQYNPHHHQQQQQQQHQQSQQHQQHQPSQQQQDTFNPNSLGQHCFSNPRLGQMKPHSSWGSPAARRLSLPADLPIMEEPLPNIDVDDLLSHQSCDILDEQTTKILQDESTMTSWIDSGAGPCRRDSAESLALDLDSAWNNYLPDDLTMFIGGDDVFDTGDDLFDGVDIDDDVTMET